MTQTQQTLIREIDDLKNRLQEALDRAEAAEDALRAIQSGEVDALVIADQVYTLESADQTYRVMVEKVQEGVATLQPDGMVLYANQRLADMLHQPLERLLGSNLLPFIPLDDRKIFTGLLESGKTGASKGELIFRRLDRSALPVMVSITGIENQGQQVLCLVATDLTEQKRQEEILAAERLARSILEQASEAIVVCDLQGRVIRASQAVYDLVPNNPLFQPFETSFPLAMIENGEADERISIEAVLNGRMIRGREVRLEAKKSASGRETYLLLSATPLRNEREEVLGCIVALTDITQRKRMELALRQSEIRYRTTLTSIGDAVITTDEEGNLTFLNPVAEQVSGWENAAAVGLPMDQILPIINEQTHEPAVNPVRRVLEEGQIVGLANHSALVCRDGGIIPIEDSAAPILGSDNSVLGVVMVFRDVTEKRRKEQELVRLNRTLVALGRSSQAMLHLEDEAAYLNEVCRIIREDCGHAMVWIGLAEDDEAKRVRPAAYAGFEEGYLETLQITWADSERGRGPTGTAIRTGQVSLCRNMLTDPKFEPWREQAIKRGYASSIVFPLMDGPRAFGALTIYSREPDPFSEHEIGLLTELANDLAYGILTLRARTAQEQARLNRLENERNRARVEVQRRLLEQREQERLQIARDLHDGPVQLLTAATFTAQALAFDWDDPSARGQFVDLQGMIGKTIADLRAYAGELRPPSLMKFGLGKAIHSYADEFHAKHTGLVIEVESADEDQLSPEARVGLFRIFQESINNIQKHAQATKVRVRLDITPESVRLEIKDNGIGFGVPEDWLDLARAGHLGLVGMRERAEAMGGGLDVQSHPGAGTTIRAVTPLSTPSS